MRLGLVVGLAVAVCVGAKAQMPSVAEQYLLQAANAERAQMGLRPLRWDPALYRAAYSHAREMAARQSISHQYAGEADLAQRASRAGAQFSFIAENVAEAPTAVRIHDAWMRSPGHRANLLDSRADAVGISVLQRNGQLYAVQDFQKSVAALSLEEQEEQVGRLLQAAGTVPLEPSSAEARQTCTQQSGFAGERRPAFVMRFTSGDLLTLPAQLKAHLLGGRYSSVAVGACPVSVRGPFKSYSVAVLLYP